MGNYDKAAGNPTYKIQDRKFETQPDVTRNCFSCMHFYTHERNGGHYPFCKWYGTAIYKFHWCCEAFSRKIAKCTHCGSIME
jgi:hypothetical protein